MARKVDQSQIDQSISAFAALMRGNEKRQSRIEGIEAELQSIDMLVEHAKGGDIRGAIRRGIACGFQKGKEVYRG